MMVPMANEIAINLAKEGINIEVIDLRSIAPLDFDTISESVKKTNKVLIAHEASKTCGFGSEIAARISEELFNHLDAPIKRVAALDCPVSFAKTLEDASLPQKSDLEKAIRELAEF